MKGIESTTSLVQRGVVRVARKLIAGRSSPGGAGEAFTRSESAPPPLVPSPLQAARSSQEKGLYQAFSDALLRYHRLDGLKDGSRLTGVQYPPVPGVRYGDEAGLRRFIDELSGYLAKQPGIRFNPPSDPEDPMPYREKIAEKAAPGINRYVKAEFNRTVESIQDPQLKAFVKRAVEHAPPEFFLAPSSSSGKYHPADEINQGGLLVHTIRDVRMGRVLADYFGLSQKETDQVSAALLLHDIQKGGIPWRGKAPDYGYDQSHGPIAAYWLDKLRDVGSADEKIVEQEVRDHMAQWNKPLPTPPKDLGEQVVSYADYLASLDDVYMSWH